jgi:hypothetical protein
MAADPFLAATATSPNSCGGEGRLVRCQRPDSSPEPFGVQSVCTVAALFSVHRVFAASKGR